MGILFLFIIFDGNAGSLHILVGIVFKAYIFV